MTMAGRLRQQAEPSWRGLMFYGVFALPLSFLALPLYIILPEFYARHHGLSLALIGVLLLLSRLADALADPFIGYGIDRLRRHGGFGLPVVVAVPLMAGGFAALFLMPPLEPGAAALWLAGGLLVTFAGFSLGSISYQAWGAEIAAQAHARTRVTGMREGFGLAGMFCGALLPQLVGLEVTSLLLALLFVVCGAALILGAPKVAGGVASDRPGAVWLYPFSRPGFGWLFAVFLANGIASAIPATLMPFFMRDALGLADWTGVMLALYLLAGALAIPLWVKLSARFGMARSWLLGMALAVVTFVWAFALPGQPQAVAIPGFAVVALLSGMALGADLVVPAALLAGIIHRSGDAGQRSGRYFGLWNFGAKLTLALAAGVTLPLLDGLGYRPGGGAVADGVMALAVIYCLLPCVFKLAAAAMLWRVRLSFAGD